jgi:colanic acid/amylovoran biosynthesis glycosyltransferase
VSPADRLGYVVKVYPRFSETFIVSELLAREAAGADITVFSLRPTSDSRFHDTLAAVRAPVTHVRHTRLRAADLWESLRGAAGQLPRLPHVLPDLLAADANDADQALELALLVRDRGITHLHAHFASLPTTVARLASLLTGVPYSFTAHAKDLFHADVDPEDLRKKLRDAHHIVTVSDFNARWLRERYGVAATRLHRVYNGLDLSAFPFTDPRGRDRVVVGVGRLVEKKGFEVLLDACALARDRGAPFPCILVGTGQLEEELRARVAALDLQDLVEMAGAQPRHQVKQLMASAAVLAAPCVVGADGDQDGLPTVLLEAMALGTPCVSTDVAGIREVVRHGETGLLVPQRHPAALAEALLALLDDTSGLRSRLAGPARRLVETEFDMHRQADQLDRLLRFPMADPAVA